MGWWPGGRPMMAAGGYVDEWERNRRAAIAQFRTSFEPLRRDLMAAGIDPSDFGRFVGRVVPGIIPPIPVTGWGGRRWSECSGG